MAGLVAVALVAVMGLMAFAQMSRLLDVLDDDRQLGPRLMRPRMRRSMRWMGFFLLSVAYAMVAIDIQQGAPANISGILILVLLGGAMAAWPGAFMPADFWGAFVEVADHKESIGPRKTAWACEYLRPIGPPTLEEWLGD